MTREKRIQDKTKRSRGWAAEPLSPPELESLVSRPVPSRTPDGWPNHGLIWYSYPSLCEVRDVCASRARVLLLLLVRMYLSLSVDACCGSSRPLSSVPSIAEVLEPEHSIEYLLVRDMKAPPHHASHLALSVPRTKRSCPPVPQYSSTGYCMH